MEEQLRRIYAQNVHNRRVLGREISALAKRLGWPKHAVKNKAERMRITSDIRKFWTQEEIDFLRQHAGSKPIKFFQKRLGRGYSSVVDKMSAMKISAQVLAGYSRADLSRAFGVSHSTVAQWIMSGWLRPTPATDRVPEAQVIRFIQRHPEEYSLKRVDESWLKGILFPKTFGNFARSEHGRCKLAELCCDFSEEATPQLQGESQ